MKKEQTIWDKIQNIDYRWLYLLLLAFTIIPIVRPLGLPVVVSEPTKDFQRALTQLPPGSVVACSFAGSAALLDEQEAQFLATYKILFSRDLKVIIYCPNSDAPVILNTMLPPIVGQYNKAYGVDYVNLGYAPLGEPGEAAFAADIRSVFPSDYYGTPLDQIPLMKDIRDQSNIDLIWFQYTSCTDVEWVIRQWVVPFNKPAIITTLGCCGPMAAPYYPTQIQGFLSGSGMGTEIEVFSGFPGPGAVASDAKNLTILPFLLFFILGNLGYFGKKLKWGG